MNIIRFRKLNSKQKKDCVLINEVKRIKFLYDKGEMNHKRSKYRRSAWDEIGKVLGMDGIDCMNRWKILRDRYRKEKRLKLKNSKVSSKKRKWLFYDMFSFLDPYLEDIKPLSDEFGDIMDQQECNFSVEDFLNLDSQTSMNNSVQQDSPYIDSLLLDSTPSDKGQTSTQLIRVIVPANDQQPPKSSPRKYVKILPKPEKSPSLDKIETGGYCSNQVTNKNADSVISKDIKQENSPEKLDTVDHLMAFMGNTIKQLPIKKQVKVCQDLTAAFFDIVSTEDEGS